MGPRDKYHLFIEVTFKESLLSGDDLWVLSVFVPWVRNPHWVTSLGKQALETEDAERTSLLSS